MFQLFKQRGFGDYVSDTFQFFRLTGKHYLKNYFALCGIPLMVLAVLTYFLFNVYFDFAFNTERFSNNSDYMLGYFQNNIGLILLGAALLFLFIVILSMLTYSFPAIYMDLYAKKNGSNFDSKEILSQFKADFGRILLFFLGLIFVITPLLLVVFFVLVLLCFILIGIPLLFFAIPTTMSWVSLSFYEYLTHNKGFFEAFGSGFKRVLSHYFPNIFSLIIMYIIIQIAMSVFTLLPYMLGLVSVFTSNQAQPDPDGALSDLKILLSLIMVVTILMSYILNNLLLINQGLVYYSSRENDEGVSSKNSIDLIGSE